MWRVEDYRKVGTNCKNKVVMLNGEEGLQCEGSVDVLLLDHVSEFKYLNVLDKIVLKRWP